MKFELRGIEDCGDRERFPITTYIEFEAEAWTDVLPMLDQFLRGCGFMPPNAELGYSSEDGDE